ncbi:MAG TPA: SDR family NAD(P)-dependent oxidoreductase [Candidatus Saccharimonadales bacterium]|nr:SDR family NAD(P)-dependent oxidoreductase [Candidatus Saccharimonadales bacterium]
MSGASSGIGAAAARALTAEGARVALAARDQLALDALAAELDGAIATPCDVREPASVAAAVAAAARAFDGLDLVVTAAGVGRFGELETFGVEDWDLVFDVGLRGTFLVVQAALPHVPSTGADVITISSVAAIHPFPGSAAYCAMKAGVRSFAQVLAAERRGRGVRVTNMVVGSVDSPFWDRAGGTELARDRMLRPEDVGRAIAWAAAQPPGTSVDEIVLMPKDGIL